MKIGLSLEMKGMGVGRVWKGGREGGKVRKIFIRILSFIRMRLYKTIPTRTLKQKCSSECSDSILCLRNLEVCASS